MCVFVSLTDVAVMPLMQLRALHWSASPPDALYSLIIMNGASYAVRCSYPVSHYTYNSSF